jgi:hypothetical protein
MTSLKTFFATVPGSVKGVLNLEELYRALLTAFGSGSAVGLLIIGLQAIHDDTSAIFSNPAVAAIASTLLSLILDILRRQSQGSDPTPAPATPATPPAA